MTNPTFLISLKYLKTKFFDLLLNLRFNCSQFAACLWLAAYLRLAANLQLAAILRLVCGLRPICNLRIVCCFFRVGQLVAMLHSTVGGLEVYFFILQNLKKFLTSLEITKWLVLVSKIYLSLLLEYMKNVLI